MPKTRTDLDRHGSMSMAHDDGSEPIQVARIRTDGGTQMRAEIDEAVVNDYADLMAAGHKFPPIEVYYDGTAYWLADGFHRMLAHELRYQRTGDAVEPIATIIHSGDRREAILHAAGANAAHGLRRTNEDKRRAVQAVLRDAEWREWSDAEIARRCHVDNKTVAKYRRETAATLEIPMSTVRRGADGRMTNTGNIGHYERKDPQPVRQPRPTPAPEPTPPTYTSEARAQYTTAQDGAQTALRAAANRTPERERKIATLRRVDEMCDLMIDHLTDYESGTGDYDTSHEARKLLRRMQNTARRHLAAYESQATEAEYA